MNTLFKATASALLVSLSFFSSGSNGAEQSPLAVAAESINVMSFNIRYNNLNDGEHAWPNRKDMVADVINFHQTDLAGLQEVLRSQLDELVDLLPGYGWLGVGRNDGEDAGEFAPIFYRLERFELVDSGVFWLSETPDEIASKGWDAALPRIATWAKFKDLKLNQELIHLNTHFDHRGELARVKSAELIQRQLDSMQGTLPLVVTGDFNVPPSSAAYQTMTTTLMDSKLVSEMAPFGPEGTFAGFTVDLDETNDRIDYVFVSPEVTVLRYGVLADQLNGRYPSDHQPVLAEVFLPRR